MIVDYGKPAKQIGKRDGGRFLSPAWVIRSAQNNGKGKKAMFLDLLVLWSNSRTQIVFVRA